MSEKTPKEKLIEALKNDTNFLKLLKELRRRNFITEKRLSMYVEKYEIDDEKIDLLKGPILTFYGEEKNKIWREDKKWGKYTFINTTKAKKFYKEAIISIKTAKERIKEWIKEWIKKILKIIKEIIISLTIIGIAIGIQTAIPLFIGKRYPKLEGEIEATGIVGAIIVAIILRYYYKIIEDQ